MKMMTSPTKAQDIAMTTVSDEDGAKPVCAGVMSTRFKVGILAAAGSATIQEKQITYLN